MGLTWCRERMEQAQNSKSPVDRILVRCSNAIKPKSPYSHSQGKIVNDFVYKGMRAKSLEISHPVPIHAVPPRSRNRNQRNLDWQTCTLTVPESEDLSKPPIPPPRKKRKRKINSVEVLNSQLPELHSPSYVIYSENLLNKNLSNSNESEMDETDTLQPLEESFSKEKASGQDRFGKLSANRRKKIKTESHPNDVKEEKAMRNDNEKKAEQKIKLVSTISLPNYNELIKPGRKVSTDAENGDDKSGNQSAGLKHPRRNPSAISLPGEGSNSILGSLSEATIHRLEAYMKRCRSFGSLKPQQILEKLEEFNKTHRSTSESSDSWSGLDDWDLGVIEYCDSETAQAPPLTPKSTLPPKRGRVSFFDSDSYYDQKEENATREDENKSEQKPPETEQKPQVEERPTGQTPILLRSESVIEGVPLEWFLDPQMRPPAIMPPPSISETKESQEYVKTPPPSPEGEAVSQKDSEPEEHSSLLHILREYKEDDYDEPEVQIDVGDIISPVEEVPEERISLNFEEIDVEIPPGQNVLNPFLPVKSRSSSLTEEQIRLLYAEKYKFRSPSIGFERSTHLLEQLQQNKETIEKEIVLKPNELISGLRRVSLCRSLPEDAFEVFVNKKKPSLRESLNEFLGFQDGGTKSNEADDENVEKAGRASQQVSIEEETNEKKKEGDDKKEDEEKLPQPTAPPLPLDPPPIVINPPPTEGNTSNPHSLVKPNDNTGLM